MAFDPVVSHVVPAPRFARHPSAVDEELLPTGLHRHWTLAPVAASSTIGDVAGPVTRMIESTIGRDDLMGVATVAAVDGAGCCHVSTGPRHTPAGIDRVTDKPCVHVRHHRVGDRGRFRRCHLPVPACHFQWPSGATEERSGGSSPAPQSGPGFARTR